MAVPASSMLALKEWAVAVKALAKGEQILVLRKGGIHRADKDFRVVHPEFLLYPTYEHQSPELLKPFSHDDLNATLDEYSSSQSVKFTHWCRVTDKFEISEAEVLESLAPYHIWTSDYADSRLRWRPKQPLTVVLLRVYSLEKPVSLPVVDEYGGCKSWVELAHEVSLGEMTPVLSDKSYDTQSRRIIEALNSTSAAA